VGSSSVGNSGGINIITESLSLSNGAKLVSNTFGIGNGGDTKITAGSLSFTGGSQLVSSTNGQGDAGSVNINARDTVSLEGEGEGPFENSAIFTQVNPGAVGQGGDIKITTGSLFLTNGGALHADNDTGTGDAGDITIYARDSVQIRGTAPTRSNLRSGVFATTPQGAVETEGTSSSPQAHCRFPTLAESARGHRGKAMPEISRFRRTVLSRLMEEMLSARLNKVQWAREVILRSQRARSHCSITLNSQLPPLEQEPLVILPSVPTQWI
jgi:hypothetical protein